jgi:hypothetical protein
MRFIVSFWLSEGKPHMAQSKLKSIVLAAAMTGLGIGTTAYIMGCEQNDKAGTKSTSSVGAQHACKGQNACKGQGGCKTTDHECKGKNNCKGQGGCNG